MRNNPQAPGFTLLEVMVALAITALVIGTLFSLLAGSKRLAFSALDNIDRAIYARAALSAAQAEVEPDYPKLPDHYAQKITLQIGELLEKPERETAKSTYALEPYTLVGPSGEVLGSSVRVKKLETVR